MRLIEQIYSVIAPHSCLGCGEEGSLLCDWCLESELPEADARCYDCNTLVSRGHICQKCSRKTPLTQMWIRADYSGTAKNLVYRMKLKFCTESAQLIAREIISCLPALPKDTMIVHVPAISSHVRLRGFDHAGRIASEVSRLTGLKHITPLVRVGQHTQIGSNRASRLSNIAQSFRIKNPHLCEDAKLLLIDDVVTTGATLRAASGQLKQAGAKSVYAAVFSRAR